MSTPVQRINSKQVGLVVLNLTINMIIKLFCGLLSNKFQHNSLQSDLVIYVEIFLKTRI